ncbi:MAG TPA: prepilin-type N-terminal cleavage/methylation domain-containing protein [Verrucomicrobiae bacterium]|nr:prepilin-type N-terminal cleavage/methylation domain-containing protein [Verrucomicrobiae bacterium]
MKTRVGCLARSPRRCSSGFSLVELLLAVALILILLGAVVFNFSSLQQNAELDEGATQLESLIRYARAHAANSGRKVRLTFEEDAGDGLLVPLGNFAVSWEPDPLRQPDQFQPLLETTDIVNSILDVVSIENVHAPGSTGVSPGQD